MTCTGVMSTTSSGPEQTYVESAKIIKGNSYGENVLLTFSSKTTTFRYADKAKIKNKK